MKDLKSKITKSINKKLKKKGFTLVELIVVITILAILGTIAFISFQSYSINARNGARLADINMIQKNLGLYVIEKGTYPDPDSGYDITYKGGKAWTQGTVGDNVITNLRGLSKKSVDPLTGNEYTYSITNQKTEYQLGSVYEGGILLTNNYLVSQANAAAGYKKKGVAMIKGNYNGVVLKVSTGSVDYILAVPSIINADLYEIDLLNIINNKSLVFDKYENIPSSYNDVGYTMTGGFDYVPQNNKVEVFSGALYNLNGSGTLKKIFLENIKETFSGTILATNPEYADILKIDINNEQLVKVVANNILQNRKIEEPLASTESTPIPSNSCATQPTYTHATFTAGTPTQVSQVRQNTNNTNPCYYTCKDGYTGIYCSVEPIVLPSGVNIITDQYFTAIDNSDGHINPDYNISNNQIYISNPVKDSLRDYDHILYGYGFWGINTSTSKSIVFKLNQPKIISQMQIGFANNINRPTALNIYSLSGSTWTHKYGSSISTTYSTFTLNLPVGWDATTWKIDFIGGTSPYYIDGNSFIIKLN